MCRLAPGNKVTIPPSPHPAVPLSILTHRLQDQIVRVPALDQFRRDRRPRQGITYKRTKNNTLIAFFNVD